MLTEEEKKELAGQIPNLTDEEIEGTIEMFKEVLAARRAVKLSAPPRRMAHHIKLVISSDKVMTISPYSQEFVTRARNLRGKWDMGKWVFSISVLDHVKALMLNVYGVTGEDPYEVCVVTVKGFTGYGQASGVELYGWPIAKAFGRDSGAKAGEGIVLRQGKFHSAGSVKDWKTVVENATFEIHDFPLAAVATNIPAEDIESGVVTIR
jgi:hypothetical protein